MTSQELSCIYAALLLNDENIDITSDKIKSLFKAADVKVESHWIDLFTNYFKTHEISELVKGTPLGNISSPTQHSEHEELTQTSEDKNEREEGEGREEEEETELTFVFDDLFN
ncbi:60S acidic ribosomal protein P1 [Tritrichomonas musculus]|uniref:60S acidic ribosomal protein P1 n=1 Tax=Tritrichomonas musculus TaxID=1915356 RepID=A0ABR2H6R5_9EUKA